jgi:hypothetical protein
MVSAWTAGRFSAYWLAMAGVHGDGTAISPAPCRESQWKGRSCLDRNLLWVDPGDFAAEVADRHAYVFAVWLSIPCLRAWC